MATLQSIINNNSVLNLSQIKADPALVKEIQSILVSITLLRPTNANGTSSIDGDLGPNTAEAIDLFCQVMFLNSFTNNQFGKTFATNLLNFAVSGGGGGGGGGGNDTSKFTVNVVSQMFPGTPIGNISTHLPNVLSALSSLGLGDKKMVLMALATIRAETAGFVPISEGLSKFNTKPFPGGPEFNLYDNHTGLGNQGFPDGKNFKGRGFIQLTGRFNYQKYGTKIGVNLIANPDQANNSLNAAKILAHFLKDKERGIRTAVSNYIATNNINELKKARRLVNGGTHGFDNFKQAFDKGKSLV